MHASNRQTSTARSSWRDWLPTGGRVRLGASACLLGQEVRFDGGHKRGRFLDEELAPLVEWVAVCPEVELGLGTPRPTMRLVREGDEDRLVVPKTGEDLTDPMRAFAAARVAALDPGSLDGFVLKRASPSCGLERVKVYAEKGLASRTGRGLFADALLERCPELPVEEEGRLNDPRLREHFVMRVFARNRWRRFMASSPRRRDLVAFHRIHKFLLQAHDERTYRELGRLAAGFEADREDWEVFRRYGERFHRALARPSSRGKHGNVLQHLLGHLKDLLDARARQALDRAIASYREGLVPLVVPLELLRFQFEQLGAPYPLGQIYLDPYPAELMLRNTA